MMSKENMNEIVEYQDNAPVDVERALDDWKAYQELTEKLLVKSDYQIIPSKNNGKPRRFKKKSAWRKYRNAFRVTTEIVDREILKDKQGRVQEATFIVRATSPRGDSTEAYGSCARIERTFSKPNHDIPSTAQTRATNRAISDLIGAGEVSAEEMTFDERPAKTVKKTVTHKNAVDAEFKVKDKPKEDKAEEAKPTMHEVKGQGKPVLEKNVREIFKLSKDLEEKFSPVLDAGEDVPNVLLRKEAHALLKSESITEDQFKEIMELSK